MNDINRLTNVDLDFIEDALVRYGTLFDFDSKERQHITYIIQKFNRIRRVSKTGQIHAEIRNYGVGEN